ncbi:MAG TPA: aminotransferase class I/II-fold pyridoxal phosphate-dependent enzyme [Verrucomicrobiae bacterium]|nr:aminotransferase class I/II-fold pyridoxal phosphate-dependent enzyme [Verrucomicrobiae bacterium]
MKIRPFELERWQSIWENQVELNISESGVHPLTTAELVGDPGALEAIFNLPQVYPQTNGSEELRSRVAEFYPGAKMENVLVTCGGSEANFVSTWSLIEPGDEVVLMLPNYMQIGGLAESFGAAVRPLWLRENLGWGIDVDELGRLITPKTKLVAVCNPNNPAGSVLSRGEREAIIAAAARVGAWVLADEVYRGAELDGPLTPSFWGSYERVLCTGGLSKSFSLPGLRIGWVVGPPEMAEKLWGFHDYTSIGPSRLSDRLGSIALEPIRREWILQRTRSYLQKNYPALRHWLAVHQDVFSHIAPKAGAIAWAGFRGGRNSARWTEELRVKKGVLMVSGELMGMESFVRFGFGGDAKTLEAALERISEFLREEPFRRAAS